MKTRLVLTFALSMSMTQVTHAKETQYEAANDSRTTKLCMTIATGNKHQIKNAIKAFRPARSLKSNYRFVANNVSCNGMFVHDFANNEGNGDNVEFLAKYINKLEQEKQLFAKKDD